MFGRSPSLGKSGKRLQSPQWRSKHNDSALTNPTSLNSTPGWTPTKIDTEVLRESQRDEYERKLEMAIEQIDRLTALLTTKNTQIQVLNNYYLQISHDFKNHSHMVEDVQRLEEQNKWLRNQLQQKNEEIKKMKVRQPISFCGSGLEGQKQAIIKQNPQEKILQYKYEKGLEEIKKLQQMLEEQKRQRQLKEDEVQLLLDRIQLCEEHLQYLEKNPQTKHQPSSPLLKAITELQLQCQQNAYSQKILQQKIHQLESQLYNPNI